MANFNKVLIVGRLTRDPETKTFANGGKVAKFGLVTNGRKKEGDKWVDEPMFIDTEIYNRGDNGKSADFVENHVHKGSQVLVEGEIRLDQWDDKQTGQKRSKHKIVAFSVQLLDKKQDAAESLTGQAEQAVGASALFDVAPTAGSTDDDIPF